jgi:uncharacterized protein with NRDE domain
MAANRDEFYARPTSAASFWPERPSIVGGRDIQAGGTWMALHKDGRMAAVTNYRDLSNLKADARSRGELPINYLGGEITARDYLNQLDTFHDQYNGFNALIYEEGTMFHYSNYELKVNSLNEGIHGLSNALLNTEWPKVKRLKAAFKATIDHPFDHEDLLNLLANKELAPDKDLPNTGVPRQLEKMLSAICIESESYGTCSSSVLTISKEGEVHFTERTFPVGDRKEGTVSYKFKHE